MLHFHSYVLKRIHFKTCLKKESVFASTLAQTNHYFGLRGIYQLCLACPDLHCAWLGTQHEVIIAHLETQEDTTLQSCVFLGADVAEARSVPKPSKCIWRGRPQRE